MVREKPVGVAERRKYRRIPKEVTVEANRLTYPVDDCEFSRGKSKNLSQGGVLLQLLEEFEPGTLLQVRITLPGWRKSHPGFIRVMEDSIGSPFIAICEVVRSEQRGEIYETAAKFINIDQDDFRALEGYLAKQGI